MPYKIDPDVLAGVAKEVVGQQLAGTELIAQTTRLLAAAYPDLIDPIPGRWVGSKAGGILGKVTKVTDQYVSLEIAEGTEVTVQKNAVTTVLPKGSLKSL